LSPTPPTTYYKQDTKDCFDLELNFSSKFVFPAVDHPVSLEPALDLLDWNKKTDVCSVDSGEGIALEGKAWVGLLTVPPPGLNTREPPSHA